MQQHRFPANGLRQRHKAARLIQVVRRLNVNNITQTTTDGYIPELIDSQDIIKAEFVAGAAFNMEPYPEGLITTC